MLYIITLSIHDLMLHSLVIETCVSMQLSLYKMIKPGMDKKDPADQNIDSKHLSITAFKSPLHGCIDWTVTIVIITGIIGSEEEHLQVRSL